MSRIIPVLLFFLAIPGCAGQRLPADVTTVLDQASAIELLSLNPEREAVPTGKTFHKVIVMGQTTLTDQATLTKLRQALYQGVRASDGSVAACFNPRHGIRATHAGQTVELVICFECLSMQISHGGKESSVLTTSDPASVFNQILDDAGVPRVKPLR